MRAFITALALTATATATAADAETLYVDADHSLTAEHSGPIVVDADGVTLDCKAFPVRGDGVEPIGIDVRGDDVTLVDCVAHDFAGRGISADGVDRLSLIRAGAVDSDTGIGITGGEGHLLNTIYVEGGQTGVLIDDVRDTVVRSLVSLNTAGTAIQALRVVDSEVSDALLQQPGRHGVSLWDGFRTTVRDVTVVDAGEDGISIQAMAQATVEGCAVHGSGEHGIVAQRSVLLTATGNHAASSATRGLVVNQSARAELVDNTTDGNAVAGFSIWQSAAIGGAGNGSSNEAVPLMLEGAAQPDLGDLGQ